MSIDVESFTNRRNDQRWNRVAVGDIIERVTWSTPDKECIVATPDATVNPAHARVTYRQANDLINRVANGLLALGLPRAARVAMLCENSVEGWLTKIGIAKAGLVATPVNVMMAPDLITDALQRLETSGIVVDAWLWESLGPAVRAAGVERIMVVGGEDGGDVPSFDDFIAGQPTTEPDITIHGDDIWEVLFTSGTTAKPKAAMISHTYSYFAGFNQVMAMNRGLDFDVDLRVATFTPMTFHIADHLMMFAPLLTGGTVILGRKPDGHMQAQALTKERVTCYWGGSPQFVEAMLRAVEETPQAYDLSSVTTMFFGWAPMAPGSLAALRRLCSPRFTPFALMGQTEAVPCHRFYIDQHLDTYLRHSPQQNHIGLPVPILASTVWDEDGNDLRDKPGVQGEAVYRSPAIFSGYYRDPAATEEALKGGWFHSGDAVMTDEHGLRIMVDRYKDMVKSGGENVSSIRVEAVLNQHPAIARAAVIGTPDDRWGEMVTACVIVADGAVLDEANVIAFARERLAGFETPKRLIVMESFPETVGGKVLKYKLRALLAG
ncbi:MAG: AMP-binding protein [Alphaproteobacteria bacterium]